MRSSDPAGGPRLRVVFEETLQPFADISCGAAVGYVLTNLAGIARASGEFPRARALLDEAAERFARADDDRGGADVMVRRGYLALSEGLVPGGAGMPRGGARPAAAACTTGAASGSCSPGSA